MNKKMTSFFYTFILSAGLFLTANFVYANSDNFKVFASIIPSDSYYSEQWYLNKVKAPEAWDIIRETPDITIAVIDSGVQINHPDLKNNIWINNNEIPGNNIDDDNNGYVDDINGWDFVSNEADPSPNFDSGYTENGIMHGTVVAGVIAASSNNAAGISGLTWKARIMPLRVLNHKGEGDTNMVRKAVDYAIKNGADIINFSFVGFGQSNKLNLALQRAYNAGIIIIAAAGNENEEGNGYNLDETQMYPVCHDGDTENWVLGVTALDPLDQKAKFSSYGYKCIDIAAPGISFYSTSVYSPDHHEKENYFNKYYDGYWAGTSMAAPVVSGITALVMQANPTLTRAEVIKVLKDTSDNIDKLNPEYISRLGAGRINAYRAVQKARELRKYKESTILIAPYSNAQPKINITKLNGEVQSQFMAYSPNFLGGVNITTGDVDGDGQEEIIVGSGNGGGPHIRIFDNNGKLLSQFFAYDENFRGGVKVVSGDLDGDGIDEIIAGAGYGGGPQVRIFNYSGHLYGQFFAYNSNFRGGVNVAVGDIDGDEKDEIITGAGYGGGPQVRIFDAHARLQSQFFAYDENFRGGVNVAVANINNSSKRLQEEIVTSPGKGGGPHIRIFTEKGEVLGQFFAFDQRFRGGVNIALIDIDNDNNSEIITAAGPGGAPHVRIYNNNGVLKESFYAYDANFKGGVSVSALSYIK